MQQYLGSGHDAGLDAVRPDSLLEMVYGEPAFEGAHAESQAQAQLEVVSLLMPFPWPMSEIN